MRLRIVLLAAALAAPAVHAQSRPAPPPPPAAVRAPMSKSKRDAIRQLLDVTGASALGAQMGIQVLNTMRPTFEQTYPEIPADVIDEMFREFESEFMQADMMELVGSIYDRHFSEDDIQSLTAFYRSPLGQRTIAAMPMVMQESLVAGEAWGAEIGDRVGQRILDRLEARGYDV